MLSELASSLRPSEDWSRHSSSKAPLPYLGEEDNSRRGIAKRLVFREWSDLPRSGEPNPFAAAPSSVKSMLSKSTETGGKEIENGSYVEYNC